MPTSVDTARPRMRLAVVGVLVTATVGVAAVSAYLLDSRTASPMTSDAPPAALVVDVETAERVTQVGVGVTVTTAPGFQAVVTTAGTVTDVPVRPGTPLAPGDVVARIDDRPVVAMTADAPLWRDLSTGDRGDDVRRLQEFLGALGLFTGEADGRFGPATGSAVAAFNETYGFGRSQRAFGLSSVTWVGAEPLTTARVLVQPGQSVAPGAPLVEGPASPVALEVTEPTGGVPEGGSGEFDLVIGDLRVPYVPGTGRVDDPAAVNLFASALGTTGEGTGSVVNADPTPVLVVPASAVVVDDDGVTCVFADVDGPPVIVSPAGGGLAAVDLPPETGLERVLTNPRQVRADLSCS